jgi:hypothetical protein
MLALIGPKMPAKTACRGTFFTEAHLVSPDNSMKIPNQPGNSIRPKEPLNLGHVFF